MGIRGIEAIIVDFPQFPLVNVTHLTVYLHTMKESEIEDTVIRSYMELYLKSLNESRPYKFIQIIKKRMLELIKRKHLKNQNK
tara:strand:+ start:679 stop:927 length:249 start_codon:yes stop_codon:yes gene_type:complete